VKGFRKTGNGPKSGFTFPSKAGFGPSSGKVKNISSYSRRAPKRVLKKAIGGIVEDHIVEAPGFSDYAKGGKVSGVSDPMTAREAMGHSKGGKVKGVVRKLTQRQLDDRAGIDVKGDPYRPPKVSGEKRKGSKPGKWPPGNLKSLFPVKQERFDGKKMVPAKKFKSYEIADYDKPIKGVPDTVGALSRGFSRTPKIGK
jgi:hypothetical protein